MVSKFRAKVGHSGNGLSITIPKAICDGNNIKQGDFLEIYAYDDKMVIPLKKREEKLILRKKPTEEHEDDDEITAEDISQNDTTRPHLKLTRAHVTSPSGPSSGPP